MSPPTESTTKAPMAQDVAEPTPYHFTRSHATVNQYIKKVKLLHHLASKIFSDAFTRYKALPGDLQAERISLTSEFGGVEDILETMWEPFLRRLGKELEEAEKDFASGDWDCASLAAQTVEDMVVPVRAIVKEFDVLLKELEATARERRGSLGSEDGEVVTASRSRSKSREPKAVEAEPEVQGSTKKRRREAADNEVDDQAPPPNRRIRTGDASSPRRESARLAGRKGEEIRGLRRREVASRPSSRPAPRTRLEDLIAARSTQPAPDTRRADDGTSDARPNGRNGRGKGKRSPAPRRRGR